MQANRQENEVKLAASKMEWKLTTSKPNRANMYSAAFFSTWSWISTVWGDRWHNKTY